VGDVVGAPVVGAPVVGAPVVGATVCASVVEGSVGTPRPAGSVAKPRHAQVRNTATVAS
jgi:hypothetical protein